MPQRNRPAIHIQPRRIGPDLAQPRQRHRRERLVHLVEVDLVNRQSRPLQRPPGRRDRLLQHNHRVATGYRQVMDARQRRQPMCLQRPLAHHQHPGRTVANLAGIGRRNHPAFLQQLHRANAFQRRIAANALVHAMHHRLVIRPVHRQRQNLLRKRARQRGRRRALVAAQRVTVQLVAAIAIFLRHHLRAGKLAERRHAIPRLNARAKRPRANARLGMQREIAAHRHPRHALHPSGDHHILRARHHRLGGKLQRLLGRPALPVDRHRRNAIRQPRRQHRMPANLEALLPRLRHAAHHHIVHRQRINPGPLHQRAQHLPGHIRRMPAGQLAAPAATRRAQGLNDIGFGHLISPHQWARSDPPRRRHW